MKLKEEFEVRQPVATVWSFFDQPEAVAGCVPGVEQLSVITPDDIEVRITQSVGPMTATFAATVKIVERVQEKRIAFTAEGRTVRGALGNVRSSVAVTLEPSTTGTMVAVEGEVALAGALGSVGQKVVAKQAGKVTSQFARNLEAALGGGTVSGDLSSQGGATGQQTVPSSTRTLPPVSEMPPSGDTWTKAAAVLAGVSVVLSLIVLRQIRRSR